MEKVVKGHGKNPGYIPGDHWVECQVCGFEYRQSVMKTRWDGVIVCPEDWEARHPQDFVRGAEDAQAAKGLVNSSTEENFIFSFGKSPWEIDQGRYTSKNLNILSEEPSPQGVAFSSDGTKAYIVGVNNDTIYQYTLGTAWDISTGSYASKSLSVAAQDIDPRDLAFSSDGTKAYIIGNANDTIYQYTLGTAWDISTGSYASKSLSVAAQELVPAGLAFSSDGTKAYVVGIVTDTIYQYTLSTAWDISTGSYASKSLSVATEASTPHGLAFSSDGTKAYVVGTGTDTIYQYTLGTAWDISTGSYASKSLSVATEGEDFPVGIHFSSDGINVYIIGATNHTIYQYTLGYIIPSIPTGTFTL